MTASAAVRAAPAASRVAPAAARGAPAAARDAGGASWARLAWLLVFGYLCLGRSFAYVGLPAVKLFIGEVALGAFMAAHVGTFVGRWASALLRPSALSGFMWGFFLFAGHGLFQVARGLAEGHSRVTTLQNFAINYYPLYVFLGLAVGQRDPEFLRRLIRPLAWAHGLYGLAYLFVLSGVPIEMPNVPRLSLFGSPIGPAVVLLGLLAFERNLSRVWPLFLVNGFVLFGLQVRASWLAFAAGLVAYALAAGRARRLVAGGAVVGLVLGVLYVTDLQIPNTPGRGGGYISVRSSLGRVLAPLDPTAAAELTTEAETYAATFEWRTTWWRGIWSGIHASPVRALLGPGYGYPLSSMAPTLLFPGGEDLERAGMAQVRSPHNIFFYALGYGGWVGVVALGAFVGALARLAWSSYRRSGQVFGVLLLSATLAEASFTSVLESPYGAIPFYVLMGLSLAPALRDAGLARGCGVGP